MRAQQREFAESAAGREWAEARGKLPVCQVRQALLDALHAGDVAVLSGDTGCGKTTQVPQYLLEHEIESGRGAQTHIICTQPRRLAAISVAERVAVEREEPPPGRRGSRVGYQVRLDNAVSADTRLTFCTTGIVLRRLASDPALSGVSHIIVDEVHERSLQIDFLLALLRRLAALRRGAGAPLKVVLMSATIDVTLLCDYWGGCPSISAQGRTFPVEQMFLEDVYEMTGYRLAEDSPAALRAQRDDSFQRRSEKLAGEKQSLIRQGWGDDEADGPALNRCYDADAYADFAPHVRQNLRRVDEGAIDYDVLEELVLHIDQNEEEGAILVFLPGMREISQLVDRLSANHQCSQGQHWIIPLHSTVAPEEQKRAFLVPPAGIRKIVVGTNIAETSITIEDVVYVVDAGKVKERRFNAARGMSMLVLSHISQASSKQRRGRAGRVRPGKCYALYTRACLERRMSRFQVPEVARVPLEELVLQIHLLQLGHAAPFAAAMLQPPPDKAVLAAVTSLQVLGALSDDEELTPLGAHLAQLPLEPHLGKLLVLSCFLGCLSSALTIAACLSYETPFLTSFAASDQTEVAQRSFASDRSSGIAAGQQSDHLVMVAAYTGWQAALEGGGNQSARAFARKNSLSFGTLLTLRDMRRQFATMLADIQLVAGGKQASSRDMRWVDDPSVAWNAHSRHAAVVKAALCAAMYPKVACMDSEARAAARPAWADATSAVAIHPSSVLHPLLTGHFGAPYVVYTEKMRTTKTFLRHVSVVNPVPLLLFGGAMDIHHDAGYVMLDNWLKVWVAAQTAVLFKKLRSAWDALLDAKVQQPSAPFSVTQKSIVNAIVGLLREDALTA